MPHRQHLLVVDDQRLDRAIASHAAKQVDFRVSCAATIAETRAILELDDPVDFVVLDLLLGTEDGLEVPPLIARFSPDVVIVLVSGFDGRVLAASRRLASSLGLIVAGVLRKPILPIALQNMLRLAPQTPSGGGDSPLFIPPEQIYRAITDGQIKAWFQPQISLKTGGVAGAEALARWVTPDGRSFAPSSFVPIAEENGLAALLADAMLDQALLACASWRPIRPDCWIAVNVSPLLLDDPGLTSRIERALRKHGVPPGALVLEITGGNGIPDTSRAMESLTRLRIRGVHLAVDDFGTGHSTLLSLVRMPFDEMKIDQTFVREATANRDARKVVRAATSLGLELGLKVVAEGVETEAMAQFVEDVGCHVAQGWLYGHAVPPEAFRASLGMLPAIAEPSD